MDSSSSQRIYQWLPLTENDCDRFLRPNRGVLKKSYTTNAQLLLLLEYKCVAENVTHWHYFKCKNTNKILVCKISIVCLRHGEIILGEKRSFDLQILSPFFWNFSVMSVRVPSAA